MLFGGAVAGAGGGLGATAGTGAGIASPFSWLHWRDLLFVWSGLRALNINAYDDPNRVGRGWTTIQEVLDQQQRPQGRPHTELQDWNMIALARESFRVEAQEEEAEGVAERIGRAADIQDIERRAWRRGDFLNPRLERFVIELTGQCAHATGQLMVHGLFGSMVDTYVMLLPAYQASRRRRPPRSCAGALWLWLKRLLMLGTGRAVAHGIVHVCYHLGDYSVLNSMLELMRHAPEAQQIAAGIPELYWSGWATSLLLWGALEWILPQMIESALARHSVLDRSQRHRLARRILVRSTFTAILLFHQKGTAVIEQLVREGGDYWNLHKRLIYWGTFMGWGSPTVEEFTPTIAQLEMGAGATPRVRASRVPLDAGLLLTEGFQTNLNLIMLLAMSPLVTWMLQGLGDDDLPRASDFGVGRLHSAEDTARVINIALGAMDRKSSLAREISALVRQFTQWTSGGRRARLAVVEEDTGAIIYQTGVLTNERHPLSVRDPEGKQAGRALGGYMQQSRELAATSAADGVPRDRDAFRVAAQVQNATAGSWTPRSCSPPHSSSRRSAGPGRSHSNAPMVGQVQPVPSRSLSSSFFPGATIGGVPRSRSRTPAALSLSSSSPTPTPTPAPAPAPIPAPTPTTTIPRRSSRVWGRGRGKS